MLTVIVFFRLSILSFSPEKDKACLRQLISFLSQKKEKFILVQTVRLYINKERFNWTRDRYFTWSSEPRAGLAVCSAKGYLHFSDILRPWVLVQPQETNSPPLALQSSAPPSELILPRLYPFFIPVHLLVCHGSAEMLFNVGRQHASKVLILCSRKEADDEHLRQKQQDKIFKKISINELSVIHPAHEMYDVSTRQPSSPGKLNLLFSNSIVGTSTSLSN